MAERKRATRIPSDGVQGPGSYVMLRPLPYKAVRSAIRAAGDVKAQAELGDQLIIDSVASWDWVDFDGEPLPVPTTAEEVGRLLMTNEATWLFSAITGELGEKNLKTG